MACISKSCVLFADTGTEKKSRRDGQEPTDTSKTDKGNDGAGKRPRGRPRKTMQAAEAAKHPAGQFESVPLHCPLILTDHGGKFLSIASYP
jgi:hypothetical protein